MLGNFYVVGTPIGNFEDMTFRAVRILSEVDMVFCEDTREGGKLLSHFNIKKPLDSFHAQSKDWKVEKIISLLEDGKNVALISDSGTPGISDPGVMLVGKVREVLPEIKVFAVPGASALTSALSIAGVPASEFIFYGFLPHKKGRETIFKEIAESEKTSVFYESPHRILKTLEHLTKDLDSQRQVAVCREMTKIYEEVFRGSALEVFEYYSKNEDKVRGEFVVVVEKNNKH
jgi:16S rRNA (cytidine1402-2'-O)-methyltransferase